jgi:uncharacterized protein (TIGR02646 family)
MAQFLRRNPAPPLKRKDYRLFRLAVREDFHETCAYCLLSERWAAGVENFELDHFRPRAVFPQLLLNYYNLYWSCHVCNRIKHALWPSPALQQRGITFVDLCVDNFDDHFLEDPSGRWLPRTPSAEYTIDVLRLNRPHLVTLRAFLRLHPS